MTYIIPRIWDGAQTPPPPEPSGHPPHECGQADEATEPSAAHYQWHRYHRTIPCPKSLAENGHYHAIRNGRGDGYEYAPRPGARWSYECGTAEQCETATTGHYQWHQDRGETACPLAVHGR